MNPEAPQGTKRYHFADLSLCVGERRLYRGDATIPLSKLSFEFLLALVEAAPNLVSHEALIERVWGRRRGRVVTAENIAKRALMLRNALGDKADDPKYFEALRGQGYRLLPRIVLDNAEATAAEERSRANRPATDTRRILLIGITAAAAIVVTFAAWNSTRTPPVRQESNRIVRFELATEPGTRFVPTSYSRDVTISADGTTIAYSSENGAIVVRELDRLEPRLTARLGTDVRNPVFSPDGQNLAFLEGGALKRVPAGAPGPVATLANVGQFTDGDINWVKDGTILVANSAGLLRVPESGGDPVVLLRPDVDRGERSFGSPELLPDGRTVMFSVEPTATSTGPRIVFHDVETRQRTDVISNATQPMYLPSGYLAYVAGGEVRLARFDAVTGDVDESYSVLAEDVRVHANGTAAVDISDDGTLIYASGSAPPVRDLVWVGRDGTTERLPVPALNYTYPRLSPLGTHIALDVRWPESDIWVWDIALRSLVRVTHDPAENALPVWHPDGQQLGFGDGRSGFANVYMHTLNSGAEPERLTEGARRQLPFTISPDGTWLLVGEDQPEGNWQMWALNLHTREHVGLMRDQYSYWNTDVSPDSRWLVYQSDESGSLEVYVRPFPNTDDGRWKISMDGGSKPMWSRDGHEIYYIDPEGWLVAVDVETFPAFGVSGATRLFDTKKFLVQRYDSGARPFDLSSDGRRFLFVRNVSDTPLPPLRLIVATGLTDTL